MTLRLLALREVGGQHEIAPPLALAWGRWSLSKWVNRRKLPVHIVDADECAEPDPEMDDRRCRHSDRPTRRRAVRQCAEPSVKSRQVRGRSA